MTPTLIALTLCSWGVTSQVLSPQSEVTGLLADVCKDGGVLKCYFLSLELMTASTTWYSNVSTCSILSWTTRSNNKLYTALHNFQLKSTY